MCGIVGLWDLNMASDAASQSVEAMSTKLRHRGPDGDGVWAAGDGGPALGHRRLSILDLSEAGAQPMESANGRTVITFNGEIYNHRELRGELGDHSFRGTSDSETLVEAIDRWGLLTTLGKLNGMFALAVWHEQTRTLSLVRDRMGIKPLYYWHDAPAGRVAFASELKALEATPLGARPIDRGAISLLMRHGYIPCPLTIFEGVRKLPPGHLIQITESTLGRATQPQAYWSLTDVAQCGNKDPFVGSDEEAREQFETLLTDSIRSRTLADVPLGAFLSGGVDSSLVVAHLQQISTSPVSTFTVGFEQQEFDESAQARQFASHLGTDHHELRVSGEQARAVIPKLAEIYDEPFADSSQIPTLLISEFARQHVKVCLSGDGGDELFGGYRRYQFVDGLWNRIRPFPYLMRRLGAPCAGVLGKLLPTGLGNRAQVVCDLLPARDRRDLYARHFGHWRRPHESVLDGAASTTFFDQTDTWRHPDGLLEEMMLVDGATYLPDDILTKLDRASMSVGLEARVPLLDHRVVEFAWRLPRRLRWRDGQSKWMMRESLKRHAPHGLLDQPKRGFGVPLAEWLRGPLRGWADSLLDPTKLLNQGILRPKVVQRAWQEHLQGRAEWHYLLWDVLMLQAWLEKRNM
jgi:asparagine synthase (glutamine-hydrolysing)